MHDLSDTKLTNLNQAREGYKAAATCLPAIEKPVWRESWIDDATSGKSDSTEIPWYQTPTKCRLTQQPKMSPSVFTGTETGSARSSVRALQPSPLRIRKYFNVDGFPITPPKNKCTVLVGDGFSPEKEHLPCPPTDIDPYTSPPPSRPLSIALSASSHTSPLQQSRERYNRYLADFADLLQGHVVSIEDLISSVKNAQANRNVKRLASFGADREAWEADLRDRIVRLRASGWRWERFRPEKYQDLCEVALAEL